MKTVSSAAALVALVVVGIVVVPMMRRGSASKDEPHAVVVVEPIVRSAEADKSIGSDKSIDRPPGVPGDVRLMSDPSGADDNPPVELTPRQVAQAITDRNVYVFDNTDSDSFKAGHVPHARLLHPGLYTAKDLPTNKSAKLIFYCYDEG